MSTRLPAFLNTVNVVRENQRFGAYSATMDGQKVFVKKALTPTMEKVIRSEIWGLTSFGQLAEAGALAFEVPKILYANASLVVTTWAPGKPLADMQLSRTPDQHAQLLAEIYASVDRATALVGHVRSGFALPSDRGSNEADRLWKLLKQLPFNQYVDENVVARSLQRLDDDIELPSARLTHADLVPQHLLSTSAGRRTLIDYDSVNLLWPRFYDVINYAHNAAAYTPSKSDRSRTLIENFFAEIGERLDDHLPEVNVIAAVRSLSTIYELMTPPDHAHNTTRDINVERGRFLERSLTNTAQGRFFLD